MSITMDPIDLSTARYQATTLTIGQLREYIAYAEDMADQTSGAVSAHWTALAAIYRGEYNVRMVRLSQEIREAMADYLLIRTSAPNLWQFAPELLPEITVLAMQDLENDEKVWWHDETVQVYVYEEVLDENGDRIWNDQGQYLADKFLETEDAEGNTTREYIGQVWRTP
jgi:hypothetical protein